MCHRAFQVMLERPLEALDRLTMVETEQPVEPPVEPKLGFRRGCGHFAAVRSEIEIGHVVLPIGVSANLRHSAHSSQEMSGLPPNLLRNCVVGAGGRRTEF